MKLTDEQLRELRDTCEAVPEGCRGQRVRRGHQIGVLASRIVDGEKVMVVQADTTMTHYDDFAVRRIGDQIAACDPNTILALIEEVIEARTLPKNRRRVGWNS